MLLKTKLKSEKEEKINLSVINNKPDYCHQCCRLSHESYGYVRDWYGNEPKIGIIGVVPSSRELGEGAWESFWYLEFLHQFFEPLGLTKENLILSYTLRCKPKRKDWKEDHPYPIGGLRKHAEASCRFHDIAFGEWKPNIFISTYDLYVIRKLAANKVLFKADLEKAVRFSERGYRPVLLMGEEPLHLLKPGLGGPKTWRGHWWEGDWPFTPGKVQILPSSSSGRLSVLNTSLTPKSKKIKQMELF